MGYLYIKDYLGDVLFTKALHHYIDQWRGKHPMPNDFFYSMNEGAGKDLNWFWKKWFFDPGIPDLAVSSVKKAGTKLTIVVTAKGSKPVPVDLLIEYADGSTQKIHRSIAVWEKGSKTCTISLTTSQKVKQVTAGDPHTPDSKPDDNVYLMK
jgi:aminopeptidase N